LLLAYYDPDGRLVYAGRAGTGINTAELGRLWRRSRTASLPLASISGLSSMWPRLHPFPKQTPTPISAKTVLAAPRPRHSS
jgi:hypothetical protein